MEAQESKTHFVITEEEGYAELHLRCGECGFHVSTRDGDGYSSYLEVEEGEWKSCPCCGKTLDNPFTGVPRAEKIQTSFYINI